MTCFKFHEKGRLQKEQFRQKKVADILDGHLKAPQPVCARSACMYLCVRGLRGNIFTVFFTPALLFPFTASVLKNKQTDRLTDFDGETGSWHKTGADCTSSSQFAQTPP